MLPLSSNIVFVNGLRASSRKDLDSVIVKMNQAISNSSNIDKIRRYSEAIKLVLEEIERRKTNRLQKRLTK